MAELQTKTVHFQNETGKKIEQEFNAPASFSRLFVRMGFHLSKVLSVQIARKKNYFNGSDAFVAFQGTQSTSH